MRAKTGWMSVTSHRHSDGLHAHIKVRMWHPGLWLWLTWELLRSWYERIAR